MKKFYLFAFAFQLSWFAAVSQEFEQDTVFNNLEEIIVSANRWEQNLKEVAGKVTTIRPALIRIQNPQTAADLLGLSENVFIQKSQLGGGSPMIRGFATNRVLIVVDGVRMNNAIFRSGNVQNVISLDPNAVDEAEVIFGPGAVIYGSDAIGGVMDFHTLTPTLSMNGTSVTGNALTRYSTANRERTFHGDVNVGLKKWAFVTSVTRSLYDDVKMGSYGPDEYTRPDYAVRQNGSDVVLLNPDHDVQVLSGYDQWNAMQKIFFKPHKDHELTYAFHYSATSDYPRYDRLILREDGGLSNAEWYYGPQEWVMNSLTYTLSRSAKLFDQAKMVVGYQYFKESRHNRGFGASRRTDRTEIVDALSVNLDFDKKLKSNVTLFYGAEFIDNKVSSVASRHDINTGEVTPTSTRYPDGASWRSAALYASAKVKPHRSWLVNLSARYTTVFTEAAFDQTFFDFEFDKTELTNHSFNGSLGVVYSESEWMKIYANLSSGFRAPNVDDIGKVFDSEPGNVVVPNPALKPEQAYNAEIGFSGFIGNTLRLELAGYYTVLDNAIARGVTSFNGMDSIDYDGVQSRVLSQQNISEVRVSGIQAGIEWQFAQHFRLKTRYNYQRGREKDTESNRDFSPTHVAPDFGSTHLVYSAGKFRADLYANYNGEIGYDDLALSERGDSHLYAKDENGNPYSPEWATLNLKAEYKFAERLMITGGVENLFDKRYRPYSSGISAPGRNFIISLRTKF